MKRALVTGSEGYIGRILCRMLKREGYRVFGVDTKHSDIGLDEVSYWCGSYDDPELYTYQKYDVIFHLGANSLLGPSVKNPLVYFDNNVSRMNKMLQHIVNHDSAPAIIFASSAATYGDPGKDIALREEHAGQPCNPYGWSKIMGEHLLEQACLAYGLKGYSMRFFNVCGGYDELGQDLDQPHILTKMCQASINKTPFYINGKNYDTYDGSCVRDYVHVADVCNALIKAAEVIANEPGTSYTEYNVCSQTKTSNIELANRVKEMFGLDIHFSDARPGDPGYLYGDNTNTKKELNWTPQCDLDDIIESHYAFVRNKLNGN